MGDAAPVIVSMTLFLVVGAVLILYFTNRHKERMTLIEKGVPPEQLRFKGFRFFTQQTHLASLKWGIIAVAIGLAIMTGSILDNVYSFGRHEGIYPALIFLYAGIGLIVYYLIASKKNAESESGDSR